MNFEKTNFIGAKLKKLIPGGAHTYSKGDDQWPSNAPKCIERGKGAIVWDADGNEFIDWSMGLTSVCLGHAHDEVNQAAIDAMSLGHNFQRPAVIEAIAAEKLLSFLEDRGEMVKFAKNGSTVTTAAVKLARAFTGRTKVGVCSEQPFFSYDDWFIGSTSCYAGIPDPIRELTVKFSFNDMDSIDRMFKANVGQIAAIILEPAKPDSPRDGFLTKLYDRCKEEGAILILDEMVTGFKWHKRGAAAYYGAYADLYTWGKGLANGHSVCALTGRRDIMELGGIDHDKPRVFLSSTTHGAEIPQLAALIKTLDILDRNPGHFERNWSKGRELREVLDGVIKASGLGGKISLAGEDCFFGLTVLDPVPYASNVVRTFVLQELAAEGQLFQGLFYITPAHTEEILERTIKAWENAMPRVKAFLSGDSRYTLVGPAARPVFRKFNSCECLKASDCQKCMEKRN